MTNPLLELKKFGQSVWYDNIYRAQLVSGQFIDAQLGTPLPKLCKVKLKMLGFTIEARERLFVHADHHFRRFNDRDDIIALFQVQTFRRSPCNRRHNFLPIGKRHNHFCHHRSKFDGLHFGPQLVPRTESSYHS
jgi:hypothetical protein